MNSLVESRKKTIRENSNVLFNQRIQRDEIYHEIDEREFLLSKTNENKKQIFDRC